MCIVVIYILRTKIQMNENRQQQQESNPTGNTDHHLETDLVPIEGARAAVASTSSLSDDEAPLGTLREERLVKKLKVIDVLSPKSSFDATDNEVDTVIRPAFNRVNIDQQIRPNIINQQNTATGFHQPSALRPHIPKPRFENVAYKTPSFSQHGSGGTIPRRGELKPFSSRITLLVNGTRFVVSPSIFTKHPNTLLGRLELTIDTFDIQSNV